MSFEILDNKAKFDIFTIGQLMEQSTHLTLELSLLKELRALCHRYDFAKGSFDNIIMSYISDDTSVRRNNACLRLTFKS